MSEVFFSEVGFVFLLSFFAIGAIGSFLFRKSDAVANGWQSFFAIAGSVWGLVFSAGMLLGERVISFSAGSSIFPFLTFSFHLDALSSFFLFAISLIALFSSVYGIGYIRHYYQTYSIGALGFFYHAFILGMLMVVTASHALFFLMAWEVMSIASYFLVVYDRNDPSNVKAGFLYLVMTHVGTAFIVLAFLLAHQFTGSYDFETMKASGSLIPAFVKNSIFLLALVGLGTKAGMIPFHVWLPSAHPAAPSHVSALMSGVMIKTGIYMMIRIFFDLLAPAPLWWGVVVVMLGSISALLGVLYALTEHDIKRLLAYHSIENIGIILLGMGSALVFSSLGMMPLALFGLGAALFHTLNHATFKSLLFLSAGSVINQTHTRNMEEYGGLIKKMPQTAFFFLVGSMAISALPPFNGFFSEWMTFQTLLRGMAQSDVLIKSVFVLAAGSLAITGGLALACFVKAFGATFLARPRSEEVAHAKESSFSLSFGMGGLAALCLLFGIFSGYLGSLFANIGKGLLMFQGTSLLMAPASVNHLNAPEGFGSVSAPAFLILLVSAIALLMWFVRYAINRQQKIKIGATWDCGVDLTSRMEITATGFARSIVTIFAGILRPSIQRDVEYKDADMRYMPLSRTVNLSTRDIYQTYLYQPLNAAITALSSRVKTIQSGNINTYVLYMLVTLVVALFLAPTIL